MHEPTEQTKGKIPDPYVLSFIACDEIIVDMASKRPTLVNILHAVAASSFPALHPKLGIFTELTNGHGKLPLEIKMVDTATETPVFGFKADVQFDSPIGVATLWFTAYNVVLPKAGEYRIQMFGNSVNPFMERRFHLIQRGQSNADPGPS